MKKVIVALLGSFGAVGIAACGGTSATADPATQTQAQSATTEASAGSEGKRPPPPHHGPPPEAFDACQSKAVGDVCTVTFGGESLTGKCVAPPDGDARIHCRPDKLPEGHHPGGKGGHPHGPPPEAIFTACDGKAADAACTVTLGDRTIEGTCKAPPPGVEGTRLGCVPARPPRPEGAPPQK